MRTTTVRLHGMYARTLRKPRLATHRFMGSNSNGLFLFWSKNSAELLTAQQSIRFEETYRKRIFHETYIGIRIQFSQGITCTYAESFRVLIFVANHQDTLFSRLLVHAGLAEKRIEDNDIIILRHKAVRLLSALVLQNYGAVILCGNRKACSNTYQDRRQYFLHLGSVSLLF